MVQQITIENLLKQYSPLKDLHIDQILFEADYPVLFSGINENRELLFVCSVANQHEMIWVVTETEIDDIISMLENRVTIRDPFVEGNRKKYLIRYDGTVVSGKETSLSEIPDELLPSIGEYMEAEEGEYSEEIAYSNLSGCTRFFDNLGVAAPRKATQGVIDQVY